MEGESALDDGIVAFEHSVQNGRRQSALIQRGGAAHGLIPACRSISPDGRHIPARLRAQLDAIREQRHGTG
jgi:hypothetical protein